MTYCEMCKDEDTKRCETCDGQGNDIIEIELANILAAERKRIKGEDG